MLGFTRLSLEFVMALPTGSPLILILANYSHRQRCNGFLLLKILDGNSLDYPFPLASFCSFRFTSNIQP